MQAESQQIQKCYVAVEDGKHYVFMPDGTKIPGIVWTRVYDPVNPGKAVATIQILVDLVESELRPSYTCKDDNGIDHLY